MTIVFVHGLPETSEVWTPLRKALDRDTVAVALPGFGTARPDGFTGTKDAYAEWLGETLSRVEQPIDNHCWMAESPKVVAPVLERFWSSLD